MKCDELKKYKAYEFGNSYVYHINEVNDAIAELKEEILNLKAKNIKLQSFYDLHGNVDNYIDKLNAENAELKAKLENVQASMYCDVVDANMENRRLKRALWIARAELCHRLDVDRYLRNHRNSWYNENCLTWADACVAMEVKMGKVESKCRAKAEEYK